MLLCFSSQCAIVKEKCKGVLILNKVAVLGAGTMGPGIAITYALHGCETAVYSRTQKTLDSAKSVIEGSLQLLVDEQQITANASAAAISKLTYTTDLTQAVEGAWYIAETIVEKPEPKRELYCQLDAILPADVIIASNTSYLNMFELLPERRQPYSLISHWYAPAHILPLVEIVRGPKTLDQVMDKVTDFHNACGKTAVRMEKFIHGFIVNRMQSAMTREVLYLVENGYCTPEDIDLAVKTSLMPRGLLLGLVQRMDFNGLDMVANGLNNKKFTPSPVVEHPQFIFEHVDKGEYGVKSGKGLYDYSHQSQVETLNHRDKLLLKSVALANETIKKPLNK